ncbi:hypothetical protein H2201_009249, partial [Coniosporium apollinis]
AAKTAPRRSRTTRPPPAKAWCPPPAEPSRPLSPQLAAEPSRLLPAPTSLPPTTSSRSSPKLPRSAAPAEAEAEWEGILDTLVEDEEDPVFIFSSVWQVRCGREVLKSQAAIFKVNQYANSLRFYAIESFDERPLENAAPRVFKRRNIRAALLQEKQSTRGDAAQDLSNQQDIYKMEQFLTGWHKHKPQLSIRVDITITVEEVALDPTGDAPLEALLPTQRSRRTATTAQRAEVYERTQAERAVGEPRVDLAIIWACRNRDCSNHGDILSGGCCYVLGSDHAANHFPINAGAMLAWGREIKEGKSTIDEPSNNIAMRLQRDKLLAEGNKLSKIAQKQQPATIAVPFPQVLPPWPPQYQYGQLNPQPQAPLQPTVPQDAAAPQSSSPAAEDDPEEVILQFIHWVKGRRAWGSQPAQAFLEELAQRLNQDGWDLASLQKNISEDQWRQYGFKPGYLARIRREIRPFKDSVHEAR